MQPRLDADAPAPRLVPLAAVAARSAVIGLAAIVILALCGQSLAGALGAGALVAIASFALILDLVDHRSRPGVSSEHQE